MNKLIKSTLILVIGGFFTKIIGMFIKIVLSRNIGTEALGIYMMILPTFNLFITLSTMGLPVSLSKIVSENTRNNRKLIISVVPIMLIFNIILGVILYLTAPLIANNLLSNDKTFYPLLSIIFTLPFISISAIIRGYFFGKERMFPHTFSNNLEQVVRLLLIIFITPKLMIYGIEVVVSFVVLTNVFSELTAIICLLFFIPNKTRISLKDTKYDRSSIKEVFSIGINTTTARIISSIGYFLEPVILSYFLLRQGLSSEMISYEYGIINGYVFPLILLPSFFTGAISNAILPILSKSYARRNYQYFKVKLSQGVLYSLLVGIPIMIILILFPKELLHLVYNTNEGVQYIRILAIFFLLLYVQSPLTSALQAMNKSKSAMMGTLIGTVLRIISLVTFLLLGFKIYALVISSIVNILFVTSHHLYVVLKEIKKNRS